MSSGTAQVGKPVGSVEIGVCIPEGDQSLSQPGEIVGGQRAAVDKNHSGMRFVGRRPKVKHFRNGALIERDQSQTGGVSDAEQSFVIDTEVSPILPSQHADCRNVRPPRMENGHHLRTQVLIQQERQHLVGPESVREASPERGFISQVILAEGRLYFGRILASIIERDLDPMEGPVQVGSGAGGVQPMVYRYHQHFPYRQSRTYDVGLAAGSRISKLDRGEIFMPEGLFQKLSGRFIPRLARGASKGIQARGLLVRQVKFDRGHLDFILASSPSVRAIDGQPAARAWGQNDDITVMTVRRNEA